MKKTNKVIAFALALLMLLPSVLFALSSCNDNKNNSSGNGNNSGNNNNSNTQKVAYSVTVTTEGGMPMTKLPVYFYEYEDGSIGDFIDGATAVTDANGKATINLPEGGQYAASIQSSVPDGYEVEPYYPLVSNDLKITISSKVISESDLSGVSYVLGDVIRDFTVTTTENKTFTLSEVLKEKKAVLINFWYTTCSWCITEFPYMQAAYENYADDLAIIALDPIHDDSLEAIKSFKSEMGLTFDVAKDYSALSSAFNVEGYPTSVMIDRYGVITLIEAGAIPSERAFNVIFEHFTADNYEQKLISHYSDIVPREKPNVQMPSAEEISQVFDKGTVEGIEYFADEKDEYSWPFVIDSTKFGYDVIKASNINKESSYAQLLIDVELKEGDVLAFDYFTSSELGADYLYVVVDGKDIYSISGVADSWETCFAYVAEETATYRIGLVYSKDSGDDAGDDTIYLKNLRLCGVSDINSPTYIYRFAATNPDEFSNYQDYVDIFLGADGYYHVDSATGPLLLANLMGYTRFSDDNYVYNMAIGKSYEAALTKYCNYASNAQIYGVCPVTEELMSLLVQVANDYGDPSNANDWLKLCCYYDAYATSGKQLEDPIKGLAPFSAYPTILSNRGDTSFPNSITYNRVIMPRGLMFKFTPAQSGTYLITSHAPNAQNPANFSDCDGWIFTSDDFDSRQVWYTYENVDRQNLGLTSDQSNVYMMVYLEAGTDYFIDIAYADVYEEGTIKFRVERLGGEGFYRFSLASPGYFTSLESITGELTQTIAGGVDVELGTDNIWRVKRDDDKGSILYADFSNITPIFTNKSLEQMIELGAFDFSRTEDDQYILNFLAMNDNDPVKCDAYLKNMWGESYATYAELYQIQDVYAGVYHGDGEDYTALARSFLAKRITAGYNADLGETVAASDPRIGCVIATKELTDLLTLLMDKYTFEGVENSWTKLCYYNQYFCSDTPF